MEKYFLGPTAEKFSRIVVGVCNLLFQVHSDSDEAGHPLRTSISNLTQRFYGKTKEPGKRQRK